MEIFFYSMLFGIALIVPFSLAIYAQTYLLQIDENDLTRDEGKILRQYQNLLDLDISGVIAGLVIGILIFTLCFYYFMKYFAKYWKDCTSLAIVDLFWLK